MLIAKLNDYAARGTLLAPRHVRSLAEGLAGMDLDEDGVGAASYHVILIAFLVNVTPITISHGSRQTLQRLEGHGTTL